MHPTRGSTVSSDSEAPSTSWVELGSDLDYVYLSAILSSFLWDGVRAHSLRDWPDARSLQEEGFLREGVVNVQKTAGQEKSAVFG